MVAGDLDADTLCNLLELHTSRRRLVPFARAGSRPVTAFGWQISGVDGGLDMVYFDASAGRAAVGAMLRVEVRT